MTCIGKKVSVWNKRAMLTYGMEKMRYICFFLNCFIALYYFVYLGQKAVHLINVSDLNLIEIIYYVVSAV